jgi:hypothetical protein
MSVEAARTEFDKVGFEMIFVKSLFYNSTAQTEEVGKAAYLAYKGCITRQKPTSN